VLSPQTLEKWGFELQRRGEEAEIVKI
jgi:hypothetical protein